MSPPDGEVVLMPYKDPERQRVAKAESARRQRLTHARVEPRRGTLGPLLPNEIRIATAEDVLTVIDGQVQAVLGDETLSTPERARVISTLASVALRAIEAGNLAERLEALERHLRGRAA